MNLSCYACEKAEANHLIGFRGPPSCVGCDARELAISHGGMKPEIVDSAMHSKWPDSKTFRQGRTLFWNWVRVIEEANTRNVGKTHQVNGDTQSAKEC